MPPIKDFKVDNLIIGSPEENEQGKFKSAIGYKGEVDEPQCAPKNGGKFKKDDEYTYVTLPPMFCYGVSETYTYGKPQTPENFDGYQVCVPLTSKETIDAPTDTEKQVMDFDEALVGAVANYMIENKNELPKAYQYLPDDDIRKAIKPLFVYPKVSADATPPIAVKGKKRPERVDDTTKPKRGFFSLIYWKKSGKFGTTIYGPGNVKVSPLKYKGIYGHIEMCVRLNWIFYGDKQVSINVEIVEANYKPQKRDGVGQRRLGANDAPPSDDVEETQDEFAPRQSKIEVSSVPTSYNPDEGGDEEVRGPKEDAPTPKYQIKTLKDGRKVKVFDDGTKKLVK